MAVVTTDRGTPAEHLDWCADSFTCSHPSHFPSPSPPESHEHQWESEHLPDPMSAGAVVPSGDLVCRICGATDPAPTPDGEHRDPYCVTHCRPGVRHSQCGCDCDHAAPTPDGEREREALALLKRRALQGCKSTSATEEVETAFSLIAAGFGDVTALREQVETLTGALDYWKHEAAEARQEAELLRKRVPEHLHGYIERDMPMPSPVPPKEPNWREATAPTPDGERCNAELVGARCEDPAGHEWPLHHAAGGAWKDPAPTPDGERWVYHPEGGHVPAAAVACAICRRAPTPDGERQRLWIAVKKALDAMNVDPIYAAGFGDVTALRETLQNACLVRDQAAIELSTELAEARQEVERLRDEAAARDATIKHWMDCVRGQHEDYWQAHRQLSEAKQEAERLREQLANAQVLADKLSDQAERDVTALREQVETLTGALDYWKHEAAEARQEAERLRYVESDLEHAREAGKVYQRQYHKARTQVTAVRALADPIAAERDCPERDWCIHRECLAARVLRILDGP